MPHNDTKGDEMKIYVTSDTHFNHARLIEFGRPEDFEERIIQSHNKIEEDAVLIHLGDFCIGKDAEMHDMWLDVVGHVQRRILIRGNHDKKSDSWYYEHGWQTVAEALTLRLYGKDVLFTHIPANHEMWASTDINVHGHTHGNTHRDHDIQHFYHPGNYHREVALENTNYQPVLITDKFILNR